MVVSLTGFLTGYHLMWNQWLQLAWLVATLLPALISSPLLSSEWRLLVKDRFIRRSALFIGYMTLRSVAEEPYEVSARPDEIGVWLLGVVALVLFAWLAWSVARQPRGLWHAGLWTGLAAAFAVLISVIVFYFIAPGHVLGSRLCNVFVYGGWNAVCTGLGFASASIWLACLRPEFSRPSNRLLVTVAHGTLVAGVFFTASRGALVAVLIAHAALLMLRGWQRTRTTMMVLAGVLLSLQLSAPLVHRIAVAQVQAAPGFAHNPLKEFVERKDNGRLGIYKAALQSLEGRDEIIFGLGQWGTDRIWSRKLTWQPEHLHSVLLATFVHGGTIGVLLLFSVISAGFRNAWFLAARGQDTCFALLCGGCVGLFFDGQTLTTILSVPRVEPLLFWFPLFAAASLAAKAKSRMIHPCEVA